MSKISDCDRCLLYSHDPHLICAVHPDGVEGDRCLDFRPNSNIEEEQQWSPEGYSWYGDELISNKASRYNQSEQMEILDNHPFFTGICPQCRHEFNRDNLTVHFDCPECDFIDDSESAIATSITSLGGLIDFPLRPSGERKSSAFGRRCG